MNNDRCLPFLGAIHAGDAVALLNRWPAAWADLVFADPPFNIGYGYNVYKDMVSHDEYVAWTRQWMMACKRALKSHGSFYIAIGHEYEPDVQRIGQDLGLHLRSHIVWRYTFGMNSRSNFCQSHTHILYFACDPKHFTFNDRSIRYPSARHTVYNDQRGHPLGRLPDDTWDEYPRVCGTFKERAGWHGCQMPEGLLARIIRASSNDSDVVLDPFTGSGTTPAVAARLGRRYVGIDISPSYVQQATQRAQQAETLRHAPADASGWTPLEYEALEHLFRETKTDVQTLASKPAAMECFLNCLEARTGRRHADQDVLTKLGDVRVVMAAG